ncbi:HoxN/HupN/NixA family nickel/cobalt transporter [Subtercola sp. RTI3]|uniref:HoxN/HupN/NixA family nickel/cobalt transporter n=1 Tax=Subtercola sp. RTI3 TaxID=3048639 RepID=UPI002B229B3F|nr:HoxN/HupN/NixA family nickel/cobalt transporter [Subtercola sp. RTI3]MEA9986929.1 HoxN/HupN/NixA family nickel/cobalt transporter [Subtercola sp. RTI3]
MNIVPSVASTASLPKSAEVIRARYRHGDAIRLAGMAAVVIALTAIGWGVLLLVVVPSNLSVGTTTFGVGVGVAAYTLGMRHAFDADHIAAIDGVTRKLIADGRRPLSVGFWFSLGHSSVVFVMALLLAFGVRSVVGPVQDQNSQFHQIMSMWGASVSGFFLYAVSVVNIVVLLRILRLSARSRRQQTDEAKIDEQLANRGFINRLFRRVVVSREGQMYPLGMLFGLGFDTATEISLLVLAGLGAASSLPWYAILCLPIIFAAGMCLFDTIDGVFMHSAYGWMKSDVVLKVRYNVAITALSILIALAIGTTELVTLAAQVFHLSGDVWDWFGSVDLNLLGFIIVGAFILLVLVAVVGRRVSAWRHSSSTQ